MQGRVRRLAAWHYLLIASVLVTAVIGFTVWRSGKDMSEQSSSKEQPSLVDKATLSQLALTTAPIDRTHLGAGVTPPTNKWFSGFALQEQPKPGYNYPNSFMPHGNGFEFCLPKVTAAATIISGTHTPDIVVTITDATVYKITDYDELMVELTYYNGEGQPVATVRVASGLPYIYINALKNTSVHFSGDAALDGGWTRIHSNGSNYGVSVSSSNNQFSLSKDEHASFFSAPSEDALDTIVGQAGTVVKSGRVSYVRHDDSFTTTLTYLTSNNKPILFARLPHQKTAVSTSKVVYQSILGDMTTDIGKEFSFETPIIPVTDKLDLSEISDEQRMMLAHQLKSDIGGFEEKDDTYFGGKQLYKMAQLLIIADQLREDELAASARSTLKRELEEWLTLGKTEPKSFLYEPSMKGIVGNVASFGSDKEFNDHHFHYGYFIYAAAVLAKYDSDFLATQKNTINLLVADIANYNSNESLPLRRSFDPYSGHSWASGISPFNDGNNQESTSEAMNAWIGISLWARQIENKQLELESDWMLSQEYRTARMYWLLEGPDPQYLASYSSPLASIVWGGKREYATFFSNEANAKLAIQLLPLSPTIKRVHELLPEVLFRGTSVQKEYGDYILMAQPSPTLDQAIKLPDSAIDDGNSRTYLYAYILSK